MDSQMQEFWKEAIHKEKLIRLNWFRRNWNENSKNVTTVKRVSEKRKVELPLIEPPRQDKPLSPGTCDKGQSQKKDQQDSCNVMMPVSRDVYDTLYEGFSKEETGRYRYLKLRKRKKPEEKYLYPITGNWQYGWGVGGMTKAYVPMHARNAIVRDSFFRKNGIFSRSSGSDKVA